MNFKKIIMALSMPAAFVACFDDSASAGRKTSEEPITPASNDNLDSAKKLYQGIVVQSLPNGYVYVYDIDESSSETDEQEQGPGWWCAYDGITVVDSVSLESPYAMVKFVGRDFGLDYNVVDLRQADTVVVNKKTSL